MSVFSEGVGDLLDSLLLLSLALLILATAKVEVLNNHGRVLQHIHSILVLLPLVPYHYSDWHYLIHYSYDWIHEFCLV